MTTQFINVPRFWAIAVVLTLLVLAVFGIFDVTASPVERFCYFVAASVHIITLGVVAGLPGVPAQDA